MTSQAKLADASAGLTARPERPKRTRFAVADELTCYYDRAAEPANIHVEARTARSLDEAAIRAAVGAVLAAEAGLRIRRAAASNWQRGYYWDHRAEPDLDPVQATTYTDEADLGRQRSDLLSASPPLAAAPPVRFLLAAGPFGDALVLNAHHACFDGLSALRLLRAVASQYTDLTGERPAAELAAAEPGQNSPARGLAPTWPAGSPGLRPPGRFARNARIAADLEPGQSGELPGYGACLVSWSGLGRTGQLRVAGYSINDLLITALVLTIMSWNKTHLARSAPITITMPVGDKRQLGAGGEWANRSRLTSVTAWPQADADWAAVLAAVANQTRRAKVSAKGQVDPFSAALTKAPVPVALKRSLVRAALAAAGSFSCDSCLISNLGVVPAVAFGAAIAREVWFSTSAHLPRGVSVGATTTEGQLRLTFRYRRALLSDPAAAAFAASYLQVLDDLAGRCDA